jgi:autotransporter-associated beta strand protein
LKPPENIFQTSQNNKRSIKVMKTSKYLIPGIAGLLLCVFSARADITNGLVGYWSLSAGPGSMTVTDRSSNGNTGTLMNFADATYNNMWTNWSDPTNGWPYALLFNSDGSAGSAVFGTNTYVTIPDSTTLDQPTANKAWTLSAWVYPTVAGTSEPNGAGIVCKGNFSGTTYAYCLYVNSSGEFTGGLRNTANSGGFTANAPVAASADTWYHVVLTVQEPKGSQTSEMSLYVNSQLVYGTNSNTYTTVESSSQPVTIGCFGPGTQPFQGIIDEVRIYNRQLTASDVLQLYQNKAFLLILNNGIGYWNGLAGSGGNATLDTTSLNFCTNLYLAPVGTADSLADLLTVEQADSLPPNCVFADTFYSNGIPIAVQSTNLSIASGGVAVGTASGPGTNYFLNNAVTYTLNSTDGNGLKDGANKTTLVQSGGGTTILTGTNAYSGDTIIKAGTLALAGSGSIPGSANIIVAGGATFDVSGLSSAFTLGSGQTLSNSASTATIKGSVNSGSGTVSLTYASGTPSFTVASGTLTLSSGTTFKVNNTGPTLAYGRYKLISSNGGSVAVSDNLPSVTVGGGGAVGTATSLSISNSELYLTVSSPLPVIYAQLPVTYTNLITLFAGANPTFSVSASGSPPIYYYWATNNVAVAGATNAGFTLTNVQIGSVTVSCVASNTAGTATATWALSVIAAPTAPYPQSVLAAHPIGYWRLNEPDDNLGDGNPGALCHDYVGGNDGLYTNVYLANFNGGTGYNPQTDPTTTSAQFGQFGSTLPILNNYAGQIQGVNFSAPTNANSNFTVEAWVAGYGSIPSGAGIVTKGYGNGGEQFNLDAYTNSTAGTVCFRFFVRDAVGGVHGVTSAFPVNNQWHHVVGVCDESDGVVSLYVDDKLQGNANIAPGSGILASTNVMSIGARTSSLSATNYDLQFSGYLNDVAIYNYALSAGQVSAQYFAAGIAPSITQDLPANLNVDENGMATLTVGATGTMPLFYQWEDANQFAAVPGATNTTLVVSNLVRNTTPAYYVIVTNLYGAATSSTVQITVKYGPPVITQDLPLQVATLAGQLYIYTIGVQGTEPFGYQWYSNNVALSGQTGSNYTFNAASGNYSVVITNNYGAVTSVVSALTAVTPATNAYATNILGLHPVGYWPLQETNAPAAATMETNYGTLGALGNAYYVGTNAAAAGVLGGNVSFDQTPGALTASGDDDPAVGFSGGNNLNETNSYLFVPIKSPVLDLNAPVTYECWFNSTSGGFADLLGNAGAPGDGSGQWGGLRVSYNRGTSVQVYYYSPGKGSATADLDSGANSTTAGIWNYCVVTYDGTTLDIYINGTLANSATITNAPNYWTPLSIGCGRWDGAHETRAYQGLIDDVAVYTNVLSPTQITNHWLAATTSGSNYMQTVINDHPLLYYRMDGVYTNPNPATYPIALNYGSSSVNGLYQSGIVPGQVPGPTITGSGTNSVAASINGVFSCVDAGFDLAFDPTGTQPFTAMTWFKGNPWDNRTQAIMGQGGNWAMNIDGTSGRVVWNLYNGGQVTSTNILNDGNWHFAAGVYDGTNSYLYVDGALNNSGLASGSLTGNTTNDLYLGGDASYPYPQSGGAGARYFAGALAQAALFTNALSAAQISQIYNAAAPAKPTISLAKSGSQLVITYTGTLLSATNVTGPYNPVAGAASPYMLTPSGAQVFYRASSP